MVEATLSATTAETFQCNEQVIAVKQTVQLHDRISMHNIPAPPARVVIASAGREVDLPDAQDDNTLVKRPTSNGEFEPMSPTVGCRPAECERVSVTPPTECATNLVSLVRPPGNSTDACSNRSASQCNQGERAVKTQVRAMFTYDTFNALAYDNSRDNPPEQGVC